MILSELCGLIDHTALKPETTPDIVEQVCREALEYRFASVCLNPVFVPLAKSLLTNHIPVCTVVGFPLGAMTTASKVFEAEHAIRLGAREIDMVLWIGGLRASMLDEVEEDIGSVVAKCREHGALLKVILECALLTDEQKRIACGLCVNAGADFVKTSTGFSATGATTHDVKLMSECVRIAGLRVKAAGGIRTLGDLLAMVEAGATRIGASASVEIVRQARERGIA